MLAAVHWTAPLGARYVLRWQSNRGNPPRQFHPTGCGSDGVQLRDVCLKVERHHRDDKAVCVAAQPALGAHPGLDGIRGEVAKLEWMQQKQASQGAVKCVKQHGVNVQIEMDEGARSCAARFCLDARCADALQCFGVGGEVFQ